ncbi:hypothetical protein ABFT23_00135 [Nocardioides sp. C4-1]|uniref:hypothetical protein n=1 Tax=Nocardioides sp. C4-1 TaxID=3151851 RepID=UPI003266FAAB
MQTRLVVRLVLTLTLGAVVAWMAAVLVTLPAASPSATVVLRTLLCLLVLTLLTRIVMRGAYDDDAAGRGVLPHLALAGVLAYAAFPATWVGRALVGQLVVDPGPATVAIDLVLWVGVVLVAGLTTDLRERRPERAPYSLEAGE